MRKNLFLAAMLLAAPLCVQAETMTLGYTEGLFNEGSPMGIGFGDSKWIDSAIKIPASTMRLLRGCTITGVDGCLSSTVGLGTAHIFLRSELEGEDLAAFELVPNQLNNIKKGVNSLKFKNPFTVPDDWDSDLYVGFGYSIEDVNTRGLSASYTPIPDAFFLRRQDGKWYDFSAYGAANIEMVVQGDNLPKGNLHATSVSMPRAAVAGKGVKPTFMFHNFGADNIDGLEIVAKEGDKELARITLQQTVKPNGMYVCSPSMNLDFDATGDKEVTFTATPLQGTDPDLTDNVLTGITEAVAKGYAKHVLAEEFSTELCGSCPPVVQMLHELLADARYNGRVHLVTHHSAYKTDFLTLPFHETFVQLYGGGSYAPGLCSDRTMTDPLYVVYFPEDKAQVMSQWDKLLAVDALAEVNVKARYTDETESAVEVTVSGETSSAHLCENPVVNFFVAEDGIPSVAQASAGKDFVHDNGTRAVGADDCWGQPVSIASDGSFSHTFTLAVDPAWKKENCRLVGFVSNNGSSFKSHAVENTAVIPFSAIASSGVDTVVDTPVSSEYFDLTGAKVANPSAGIFIKRTLMTDGTVKIEKTVLR